MPYNIGCGLAGGDWELYSKYLEESNLVLFFVQVITCT